MKIDHSSDKPLHIQAEEILRRLIESEEYKTESYFLTKSNCLNNYIFQGTH